jgi:hypothetical protein
VQNQQANLAMAADAARSEAESAKTSYSEAMDRGDWSAAAESQERIAAATLRLQTIEAYQAQTQQQQRQRQPVSSGDPVEDYARGRTAKSAAWIRSYRDYVTDPQKFARLNAAHYDAVGEGLEADSSEYYRHVEGYLNLHKGEGRVGRSSNNQVVLTKGEADAATSGAVVWNKADAARGRCRPDQVGEPVGLKEYAARKRTLMAQGYYDRQD